MGAITALWDARASITATGLGTLASATYVESNTIDLTSVDPLDVAIELEATPGTVSGNKQALVFLKVSFDNTNFSTGPGSGTTRTDEPALYPLGALPLPSNTTQQRKAFPILMALGFVPPYAKVVVFNDSGAAFSAAALYRTSLTGNAA